YCSMRVIRMKARFNHTAQTGLALKGVDPNSMPTRQSLLAHAFYKREHYTPNGFFVSHLLDSTFGLRVRF
ncbi:MAG: hypothetical protein ABR566_18550, partial [Pyrinomonadaceae bacterium]